ncbi:MAG: MarR family transcriptional regulator [Enterovirga sp.]|jgi:DNA-binding MarR family transcriptional regulator|nr:MarR family transcriptional regulator [Enterovirga sp.]
MDHCNALAIRKAARHVTQLYDRHLASVGLKVTQYSVLMRLRHLGPRTINELAAELQMDRTTMGRTIRPLERDGLVSVTADPSDGRRRALALTAAGLERLRAARAGWRAAQDQFEAAYGAEEALRLRETLAGLNACDFTLPASPTNIGDNP